MRRGTGSERRTRWRVNVEPTFHARAVMPPLATGGRYRPLPAGPEASTLAMRRDKGAGMDDHSDLRARADVVGAFWATNAVDHLNTALFAAWTIVYLGVAPLLLGVAIVQTRRYPGWVGALAGLGGAECLVVGFVNLMRTDQGATQVPF